MSPELPRAVIKILEHKREEAELKQGLMGKVVDIVAKHGQPATAPLGLKIITFLDWDSLFIYPMHKRDEAINFRVIDGLIQDKKGNSIKVTVASHGKKEPAKADLVSVNVPSMTENGMDTLLLRKYGEKIEAKMWDGRFNRRANRMASIEDLKTVSDALTLFQTSLSQKTTPAAEK